MGVREVMEEVISELRAKDEVKTVMEDAISSLTIKDQTAIVRELRDLPPAHYLFKIKNFSQLSNAKIESYESTDFEVGGYKWRLCVYPGGNKKANENAHISLYLVLSKSNALPLHQEVNVCFKFFVYNQIQDKYLTVQDAKESIRRFRGTKTEWGFDQLVLLNDFNDASNGYLVDDCCIFGAEIFVIESKGKGECANIVKELVNSTYTWNIQNFSSRTNEFYRSPEFVIGGHKWNLSLYPNGYSNEKGKSLSVYLRLEDSESLNSGEKINTEFILRVRDKLCEKHHERKANYQFCTSTTSWGFSRLIDLSHLKDASKGFIVDDTLIVEVQLAWMAVINELS